MPDEEMPQINTTNARVYDRRPEEPEIGSVIHPITIHRLNGNGYLVEVGCKKFAIENKTRLIQKITEYILDPVATEQLYFLGKLF